MVAHVLSVRYNHYKPPPNNKIPPSFSFWLFFCSCSTLTSHAPFQSVFVNLGEDGKIKTERQRGEREMFHQFNAYLL